MTIVLDELKDIQNNIDDKIARIRNVLENLEEKISELEKRFSELEKVVKGLQVIEEMRWRGWSKGKTKMVIDDEEYTEAGKKFLENCKRGEENDG